MVSYNLITPTCMYIYGARILWMLFCCTCQHLPPTQTFLLKLVFIVMCPTTPVISWSLFIYSCNLGIGNLLQRRAIVCKHQCMWYLIKNQGVRIGTNFVYGELRFGFCWDLSGRFTPLSTRLVHELKCWWDKCRVGGSFSPFHIIVSAERISLFVYESPVSFHCLNLIHNIFVLEGKLK